MEGRAANSADEWKLATARTNKRKRLLGEVKCYQNVVEHKVSLGRHSRWHREEKECSFLGTEILGKVQ